MTVFFHEGDLPDDFKASDIVAIDTETMGLNPNRDRLCLLQLSNGDGTAHLVRFMPGEYNAPNLVKLMKDPKILKLFHFGRFDIAVIEKFLGVQCAPVYCTKIASKLCRTYTDRHGLKEICRELISVEISKQQQSSDWGSPELSEDQMNYAASDVLYLHQLRDVLNERLVREGRMEIANECFKFLPKRAKLDLMGWEETDIFAHS
tara:strand:+ start:646 stop:1260 length:615 start_codon:yes stop_codon:yes gene_type:complete